MTEKNLADQAYGRCTEGVHLTGYSFERVLGKLEWLLEEDRWKLVGDGFDDINVFLNSINLGKGFRLVAEQRKRIASRIKELQPDASNRQVAKMLGTSHQSINRDLAGPSGSLAAKKLNENKSSKKPSGPNGPEAVSGAEAAQIVERKQQANARKEAKAEKRQETLSAVFSDAGPFDVVVIDPPWPMQKIDRDVRPNQAKFDYDIMEIEEIETCWREDIAPKLSDDVHAFWWTTEKYLPPCIALLERLGLRYVLTMVWHKPGGFQPHNLPQYNAEFIVYARKGSPVFTDIKDFNVCNSWPRGEHSRKPDEFYDLIARVTGGSRIDVFAREAHPGFATFGKESDRFSKVA